MDDQNKNLILATVLSFLVILGWFVVGPMLFPAWFPTETATTAPLTALPAEPAATATTTAETLAATPAAEAPRLTLDTPKLFGSISTLGGRFDDLSLKTYRQTTKPDSDNVELLSPVGSGPAYYAVFGFQPGTGLAATDVPGCKHAAITCALNSGVCLRRVRGGCALNVLVSIVSTKNRGHYPRLHHSTM